LTDDRSIEPIEFPSDQDLSSVVELAREQVAAEAEVAQLEKQLAVAKARLATVRDDRLPKAMLTLGLSDCTLDTGHRVEVRERFQCGQLDDSPESSDKGGGRPLTERLDALAWLDESGHGDIARRTVTITLGAKSEDAANQIIDLVRTHPAANSFLIDQRRVVPWNTLAKFTKEQLSGGGDPPMGLLGVSVQTSSKITRRERF
jgi:hypothetical protein